MKNCHLLNESRRSSKAWPIAIFFSPGSGWLGVGRTPSLHLFFAGSLGFRISIFRSFSGYEWLQQGPCQLVELSFPIGTKDKDPGHVLWAVDSL